MSEDRYLILTAIILFIYLIVGLFPSKKNGRENFLISNKLLKAPSNGFSIASSKIGGGLFITYSTLFFAFGISALFYFAGIIFGYVVFYFFAIKVWKESKENNYYTIADYFKNKYNNKTGIFIGILTTLSGFGWILTNLVAGSLLISELTLLSPYFITIILSLVIGGYLFIGGFNSVIRTDYIQYIALVLILVLLILSFYESKVVVSLNNLSFEKIPIGQVFGFFILGLLFPMGSAELWQRVYASKSKKSLLGSITVASISYVVVGILLTIICLMLLNSNLNLTDLNDELKLALGVKQLASGINPVLDTLWVIAFISLIISSADTFVYTASSSFVQDILEKFKIIEPKDVVKFIKYSIITNLIFAIIISVIFEDVVSITFFFVGVTLIISSLAYVSIFQLKSDSLSLITSGALGFIAVLTHFSINNFKGTALTALIGFIVTIVSILIINLVKKLR